MPGFLLYLLSAILANAEVNWRGMGNGIRTECMMFGYKDI
jgi:hypothetical protein